MGQDLPDSAKETLTDVLVNEYKITNEIQLLLGIAAPEPDSNTSCEVISEMINCQRVNNYKLNDILSELRKLRG